ncbi:hypothetical protein WIW50_02760 [Flavobacteriaceae bacterium 3-367]
MKIKSLILVLFATSISHLAHSQINQDEIYGQWKVKQIVEKPSDSEFAPLVEGFGKATFSFEKNGNFKLATSSDSPLFAMVTEMMDNTNWKFDSKEQLIRIGGEEDGYSIMGIYPKKQGAKILFHLDESGMSFEMEKN